ncbi:MULTISPECIES: membrane protein insertase YidC [Lactobacillus]|jgi:YidC/Oxa1 family membrane protein insertase|uniref:Insertase n=1 Tax=Lactobacillus gallinarum TaxID=52242 RepID=A0A1Y4UD67_9LACO|nr:MULTISPECIES: membrane protein insertase YidC [Lactobacillus]NMB32056.1 membrane protein insertase YidC [Lactobacillus sp.]MBL1060490.1 membrane protein insertase YidC [Lactobacillus sp. A27]MCC9271418.1 membrane protein insertase YidC [Lactobacillus gallinarum]MDM8277192.1 membrane protein insertase YidC [Lactobacillus gallinarum]MDM8282267.1 membrane protein insertase YidC [Lactobacillus gallinarum]
MKKIKKYTGVLALLVVTALVLSACGATNNPNVAPHSGIYGWVYQWLGRPLQNIMIHTAHMVGGDNGAGWGIVIITVVVRLILMPLMLVQQNKSVRQQEKMARLQPQMKLIQTAMKHKGITPQQQMTLSGWQRELYSKNEMSLTGGIGCLPLIIQLPIMWGIYQAVFYSPQLAHSTFFGISLSQKSVVLAIVATIFTVIQGYISLIGIPEEQKKTMQSMMIFNPIMTLFFSLSFSGALALYWAAGNLVMIIQQIIVTFILTPSVKKHVADELKDKPVEIVVTKEKVADLFDTNSGNSTTSQAKKELHQDLRNRNKGKQKRK